MKNQIITLGELARESGVENDPKYSEPLEAVRTLQRHFPDVTENGRMSYGIVQKLICVASKGEIEYGGQGKNDPDWIYRGKWGETKSFKRTDKTCHVAASSFFAKNSNVPEHNRLLKENPAKAKAFLFEHSYDKNTYYCLTGTGKVGNTVLDLEDVELIFVKKSTLIECLTEKSNYKKVDLDSLRKKVTNAK